MFTTVNPKKSRAIRLAAVSLMGLPIFITAHSFAQPVVIIGAPEPQPVMQRRRQKPAKRSANIEPRTDYSRFSHRTHVTQEKLSCDACHKFPSKNWKEVRKGDAAFPDITDFPEHSTCLNCHRQQFFARQRPAPIICSNCHVSVTPRDTTRFLFPSLGDVSGVEPKRREFISDFGINFPHDKHADVVSLNSPRRETSSRLAFVTVGWQQKKGPETEPKSCPVCHQTYLPQGKSDEEYATKPPKNLGDAFWLKKGTFKTIPNSHTTCFSCHNPDLGIAPAPSECNGCHKLNQLQMQPATDFDQKSAEQMAVTDQTMLRAWGRRISSGAYRHEGGDHPNVVCTACHKPETMNTLDPKTLRVAVKSCGGAEGCHITATTDDGGILNYEIDQKKAKASFECTKCHMSYGKQAVPANHVEAISLTKK